MSKGRVYEKEREVVARRYNPTIRALNLELDKLSLIQDDITRLTAECDFYRDRIALIEECVSFLKEYEICEDLHSFLDLFV